MVEATASAASAPAASSSVAAATTAPKARNFKDKEKPMEVRASNIIAAKGSLFQSLTLNPSRWWTRDNDIDA